ncbi:ABC transporter ATP-binding protein [Rhizobium sp. CFBP 8752]|uniref:ABC transporter ATP-binding protein n=1 Tax=Rhizobium sp. CFBP 8752 TaxID=2775301 RepID=UPI00177F7EDF|nr:ABC transporter ATP-binding protein [Rhizobium sp. CFBP 8752]MBD8664222.1 ABC transporter ATP-binding protein [Rhizobium sp. CFBP 8752]
MPELAAPAPILELRNVAKRFGGVSAVDGLSAQVRPGSVHGLIGPNGAGKTTLINLITGLFHPTEGEIHFEGKALENMAPQQIAHLGISRTYQNVRLFSGMTVLEQVMTGCYLSREVSMWSSFLGLPSARAAWKRTRENALQLLKRVAMDHRADELAETLSYGEQRRIEIARALGANPRLLLLDEPTAGMNHSEASAVGRLVHELRDSGLTILMVEHNMGLVTEFCDTCTVVNFGRLLAEGDPKTCIANPDVQEAYFGRKNDAERIQALR